MSFLDSIFGGGSQTVETEIPGYIETPSRQIGNRVNRLLQRPDQRNFNPFQQQGLNQIVDQARAGNPFLGQSTGFLQDLFTSGGLGGAEAGLAGDLASGAAINPAAGETARIAFGGELGQNPFLESTFNRAANVVGDQFRENLIPGLDNEYAAAGRSGSRRYAGERNRAEDAYGRQINDLANQVFGGAYESDLGRRDQALGNLGNLGQQDVQNRLSGAGLFQQGRQNVFGGLDRTAAIDAARFSDPTRLYEAGNLVQQQPFTSLNTGADILARLQGGQSSTTSQQVNPFSQLLGLGTGIAGLDTPGGGTVGARLLGFSDAALKRDVQRIGALPSGLPVYRFRYVWSDQPQVGVMAHEALELFPDAVGIDRDSGWLLVNYHAID